MTETNVVLQPQERTGKYLFNGNVVMTANFERVFDGYIFKVILESLAKIHELALEDGADYFQVLTYQGKKYWCIDDVSHITFLMPEDY